MKCPRWIGAALLFALGGEAAAAPPRAGRAPADAEDGAQGSAHGPVGEDSAPSVPENGAVLAEAKEQFRRGTLLLQAGDLAAALERFQKSRALVPSAANTVNAAYCLEKLGRIDEALELYEVLLTRFDASLDEENRRALMPAMAAMKRKVGSLDVWSNVGGVLIVDGRRRAEMPLTAPMPVMPGERLVRIEKPGYEPFEQRVTIAAGGNSRIGARLEPLELGTRQQAYQEQLPERRPERDQRSSSTTRSAAGAFYVAGFGGWALSPGFGSDAEQDCNTGGCTGQGFVNGVLAGARGGWQAAAGAFGEVAFGFMFFRKSLARTTDDSFPVGTQQLDINYRFNDRLTLSGPVASLGGGYRATFATLWETALRLHVGGMLVLAEDAVGGEATAGGQTVPVTVDGSGEVVRTVTFFLQPEVDVGYRFDNFAVGLAAGAAIFPLAGPRYALGDARAGSRSLCSDTPRVDCAPHSSELAGERAFAGFVAAYLSLYARYAL